jgi:hypothetical protein
MTWAAERIKLGRQPVTVFEIDLDFCANTYGTAPCTATYATKCFNTFSTCRDIPNFVKTTKTYRFSNLLLDAASGSIPSLVSVTYAPTKIDPANGLGNRASVSIVLTDHTHSDVGIDPYLSTRTYNPLTQGTFWGRLLARNKYYLGRVVRIKSGYLTAAGAYDAANFTTGVYVIDKIDGPNSKGQITITAKDVLKLADDDKAQVPKPTLGLLTSSLASSGGGTFSITTGQGTNYAASGTVLIDSELITYTRSADVFTIVSRSTDGSTIAAHSVGSKVQDCVRYTATLAYNIVYDILVNKVGVPSAFIDKTAWDAEAATWMTDTSFSSVLSKPTGATTLITDLAQQGTFYIWWDERSQLIQLKAIRPETYANIKTLDDTSGVIADSAVVTMLPQDRLSQVWVYYGLTDQTKSATDPANFSVLKVQADLGAEGSLQYGQQAIAQYFSRWMPAGNPNPAALVTSRALLKYRDTPRQIKVTVDAKDADIWTGNTVKFTSNAVQDATGAPSSITMQVIQAQEIIPGTTYELLLTDAYFSGRYCYIMANGSPDFPHATDVQVNNGGFISDNSGLMSDSSPGYKIV